MAPKKKVNGYLFSEWNTIEKICYPRPPRQKSPEELNRRLVGKYQQMAARATFSSPYQRKVMKADSSKSLYKNGITTGVTIEGQVISLAAVENGAGLTWQTSSGMQFEGVKVFIPLALISGGMMVLFGWSPVIRQKRAIRKVICVPGSARNTATAGMGTTIFLSTMNISSDMTLTNLNTQR